MSITATDFTPAAKPGCAAGQGTTAPVVTEMPWGFAIGARPSCDGLREKMQTLLRFFGTFSLASIVASLATPDFGAHPMGSVLKLALIFAVALVVAVVSQAGIGARRRGFHIDTRAGEVRVGHLRRRGRFALITRLPFAQVHSVYLYRTKDRSRPARLFLRLDEGGTALEVARGPEHALDALRARLARTLAPSPKPHSEART